jgi:hypothetical protein
MDNPIKGMIDKAAEEIAAKAVEKAQQLDPDPDGELEEQIKDPKAKEKFKEAKNKAKEAKDKAIADAKKAGSEYLESIKCDLRELGSGLGLLSVGTAQFSARIAMVPPAIISTTPMGPGVSANLIPPLLQQLKAEGDNLSKVYDDCDNKMSKLQLVAMAASIPSVASIVSTAQTVMGVAKGLITLVGASVGGASGAIPDIEPPISISYEAKDCSNFSPIKGTLNPVNPDMIIGGEFSAENCKNFSPMTEGDKPDCNKCKRFNKKS